METASADQRVLRSYRYVDQQVLWLCWELRGMNQDFSNELTKRLGANHKRAVMIDGSDRENTEHEVMQLSQPASHKPAGYLKAKLRPVKSVE